MLGRSAGGSAPNAVVHPVVDYAPDWHGGAMFAALSGAAADTLNSGRPILPTSPTWNGWVRPLQGQLSGAVASLGRARVYSPTSSTLSAEKTTDDVTAASIFRERMARGLG